MKFILSSFIFLFFCFSSIAQQGKISGKVLSHQEGLEFVTVSLKNEGKGSVTNQEGKFEILNISYGKHIVIVSLLGYETQEKIIEISENNSSQEFTFELKESFIELGQVVITGTKTFKRQTDSPVIVNVIDSKALENVQACNLAEGLKFQSGLRVETDCQTCNYTQLRMNGLAGGYSQILINGRPIFSPLMGLYGMEQIPVNMIERIETVRGGGSCLYGSSAIGGVVNVITKIPKESAFQLNSTWQNINGKANDRIFTGNGTIIGHHTKNIGASFFINNRDREYYDHNEDNYSELPALQNNSFGTNIFFLPRKNHKLEVSLSSINEYRYGGEMVKKAAYLTNQAEERTHNTLLGSMDYRIDFNNDSTSLITYVSGQKTNRDHYTGILPDDSLELVNHFANSPYGTSTTITFQGGMQFNHQVKKFITGTNIFTVGAEYVMDDVLDVIDSYNYKIDQTTQNIGAFLQSDWMLLRNLNLLTGVRADKHNLVNNVVISPRVSALYKFKKSTQFRLTYSTGFRAPQAFDSDMHIAFSGGGISRISLSPDLQPERSNGVSGSINYDRARKKHIVGFTIESFYTHLNRAFYMHNTGVDEFGERFEKRNGDGAIVQGVTVELRGNYNKQLQIETGFTFQKSTYENPVLNSDALEEKSNFLRTPNQYGFATLSYTPTTRYSLNLNYLYTGKMDIMHLAGAPEQTVDEYVVSKAFNEFSIKTSYSFFLKSLDSKLDVFVGVKNIFNAYQNDFDTGKNRDSNFVYGASAPRTFFLGLKLMSL